MSRHTIHIGLGSRAYDILIASSLLNDIGVLSWPLARGQHAFIITDNVVGPLYMPCVQASLEAANFRVGYCVIPAGEESKQFEVLQNILTAMADDQVERTSLILALGGGVVGDVAGFAASIFLRGLDFIQIPTTLLSQTDSAVGGKTGINTSYGKNTVGTFYQPRSVFIDTSVLGTLPHRHILSGYAEIAKYGLMRDASFWAWLETHGSRVVSLEADAVAWALETSCRHKAAVVVDDEREAGSRALLNLGHTFAHAIECEAGYTEHLLHGEAVALGLVLACRLSAYMGLCPVSDVHRIQAHFSQIGLWRNVVSRFRALSHTPQQILTRMLRDKKVQQRQLTLILMEGIGRAFICSAVKERWVLETLETFIRDTQSHLSLAFLDQ